MERHHSRWWGRYKTLLNTTATLSGKRIMCKEVAAIPPFLRGNETRKCRCSINNNFCE